MISIFPTEILVRSTSIDIREKITELLKMKKVLKGGVHYSNIGGWQSPSDMLGSHPMFKDLYEDQMEALKEYTKNYLKDVNITLLNTWANINKGANYNLPHTHPNSTLSCVTYLEVPGGALIMEDPRAISRMTNNNTVSHDQGSEYVINPKQGDIIVFPSWLRHRVTPSFSDSYRVSIASNYLVEVPK